MPYIIILSSTLSSGKTFENVFLRKNDKTNKMVQ